MRIVAAALVSTFCVVYAAGQDGKAPSGYYPPYYNGSTFKGVVQSNSGGELTLVYNGKKGPETFIGHFENPCSAKNKQGVGKVLLEADVPLGAEMIAFYNHKKITKAGKKEIENEIIGIAFTKVAGVESKDDQLLFIPCTKGGPVTFQAY